jgi:hypothetical protein
VLLDLGTLGSVASLLVATGYIHDISDKFNICVRFYRSLFPYDWEILHPEHFQLLGDIALIELCVCQASNNLPVVRK